MEMCYVWEWKVDCNGMVGMVFFFCKQKTAYEMLRSLVGSEMCIRDRNPVGAPAAAGRSPQRAAPSRKTTTATVRCISVAPVSYTHLTLPTIYSV